MPERSWCEDGSVVRGTELKIQGSVVRVPGMTKLSPRVRRVASSLQFQALESRGVVPSRGRARTLLDKHKLLSVLKSTFRCYVEKNTKKSSLVR